MSEKNWSIEYKNEPMFTCYNGIHGNFSGFFQLKFQGNMYGIFSEESLDHEKTGDILIIFEQILNDAHNLALNQVENDQ